MKLTDYLTVDAAGNRHSGGAGRKKFLGKGNFHFTLAFAAAIFRTSEAGTSLFVLNLSDNDKKLKSDFLF
jgi:hypothetical protein